MVYVITMKNGILDITIFELFDVIREKHKIKDVDWAIEAGLKYSSRISEARKMLRLYREGKDPSIVGRAFPAGKCVTLFKGLQKIIGAKELTKEMLELLERTTDRKQRIIILSLLLEEGQEVAVEMFLVNLLKATLPTN